MATFIERCLRQGDWENDGGLVDIDLFQNSLALFESGRMTNADIHLLFNCTPGQAAEMEEITGTMPANTSSVPQAIARARWVVTTCAILRAGLIPWPAYDTPNKVRLSLGLAAI